MGSIFSCLCGNQNDEETETLLNQEGEHGSREYASVADEERPERGGDDGQRRENELVAIVDETDANLIDISAVEQGGGVSGGNQRPLSEVRRMFSGSGGEKGEKEEKWEVVKSRGKEWIEEKAREAARALRSERRVCGEGKLVMTFV